MSVQPSYEARTRPSLAGTDDESDKDVGCAESPQVDKFSSGCLVKRPKFFKGTTEDVSTGKKKLPRKFQQRTKDSKRLLPLSESKSDPTYSTVSANSLPVVNCPVASAVVCPSAKVNIHKPTDLSREALVRTPGDVFDKLQCLLPRLAGSSSATIDELVEETIHEILLLRRQRDIKKV